MMRFDVYRVSLQILKVSSRKDTYHCGRYCAKSHCSPLCRARRITSWHRQRLKAGQLRSRGAWAARAPRQSTCRSSGIHWISYSAFRSDKYRFWTILLVSAERYDFCMVQKYTCVPIHFKSAIWQVLRFRCPYIIAIATIFSSRSQICFSFIALA